MNILYMAISRDGFIADINDVTPWSDEEWSAFQSFVKSCDIVLLGKRTFNIMEKGGEFVDGVNYRVVTNEQLDGIQSITIVNRDDMPQASRVGIIGGGDLNGRLAKLGLIDEVILDIEDTDLNSGIRLYGDHIVEPELELIDTVKLSETLIQKHFRVIK